MLRIRALIGIGFMLVGALTYGLPPQGDAYRLVPAFVGLLIGVGVIASQRVLESQRDVTFLTMVSAGLLIVYSLMNLNPDWMHLAKSHTELVSDLSIIGFSVILLASVRREISQPE